MASPQQPRMSMAKQFFICIALFSLMTAATVMMAAFAIGQLTDKDQAFRSDSERALAVVNLKYLASEHRATLLDGGTGADKRAATLEWLDILNKEANVEIDAFASTIDASPSYLQTENLKKIRDLWTACHEAGLEAVKNGEDAPEAAGRWRSAQGHLAFYLHELTSYDVLGLNVRGHSNSGLARRIISLLVFVSALGLMVSLTLSSTIVIRMRKRLKTMAVSLHSLSAGLWELEKRLRDTDAGAADMTAANAASVDEAGDDLTLLVEGAEPRVFSGKPASPGDRERSDRQYAVWADLPPDVRSALLILARRLDRDKGDL